MKIKLGPMTDSGGITMGGGHISLYIFNFLDYFSVYITII